MIVPVILCGGEGSRLWPLSRRAYPKQLLALCDEQSMMLATIYRTQKLQAMEAPLIVCNKIYRFLIADQLQQVGLTESKIIVEPVGRSTAPAVALAALQAQKQQKDAILLVLPADHLIKDLAHFAQCVNVALSCAKKGHLVTFGIQPTRAEIGFGYIKAGAKIAEEKALRLERFIEKPDQTKAQEYFEQAHYYWNSGMFVFKASTYLAELKQHAPAIFNAAKKSYLAAQCKDPFVEIPTAEFKNCPQDSIDYAVMEKTQLGVVVPMDSKWSDIGSWQALMEMGDQDEQGNVLSGDVITEQCQNSYFRSTHRLVAGVGVDHVVVVETADAVLVADRHCTQQVSQIVKRLRAKQRPEADLHRMVYRPWGHYEGLDHGPGFQVKRLTIKPGAALSLQMHHHRSEHWIVVSGTAEITCGEKVFLLHENQSTYIPQLHKHRIRNVGKIALEIIEVQVGGYLNEDDIVRFQDAYGRMDETTSHSAAK